MDIARNLRTPNSQIGFLLMCGYFKATKRFYQPQDFHSRDILFAAHQLNLSEIAFQTTQYTETTRLRHQRNILDFYGFAPFGARARNTLITEIATMARTHLKPRLIFDRCVDFLIQHRSQVPTSRNLTDLIRGGLHNRKVELIASMDKQLSDHTRNLLDALFTAPDDQNRYKLTLLKKLSQSTRQPGSKNPLLIFRCCQSCTISCTRFWKSLTLGWLEFDILQAVCLGQRSSRCSAVLEATVTFMQPPSSHTNSIAVKTT